jgi:transposase
MGVDELYRGKKDKFLTVVCNLETGEPLWFGKTRKKETLDEFFRRQLRKPQRKRIEAACVDMWEPFRLSIEEWAPQCKIVYDKFHIIQHANNAIDEVRKAEFFRQGKQKRGLIKRKKWLLMSRWKNLTLPQRGGLNRLFQLNRRVFKAYLLKESLERLLGLSLRGRDAQLPAEVDGSTEVATADAVRGTRRHAGEAFGGNLELLPNQGSLRRRRGTQWKHSDAHQPWPRL